MRRPSLLISDLDRTILTHDHALPPRVADAFARAQQRGLRIVIATARSPRGLRRYLDVLPVSDVCICFNGGWIGDPRSGKAMRNHTIARDCATSAFGLIQALEMTALWYAGDEVYATRDDDIVRRESSITGESLRIVPRVDDIPVAANKIMCVALTSDAQRRFEKVREFCAGMLETSRSHARLLEIAPKGIDKADAANFVCKMLGVSREHTAAAGDAQNDLRMLQQVGFPVTVANALPEIRRIAMFIAPSCDEGGMAEAVEWLLTQAT